VAHPATPQLVLASSSPRRLELLARLGLSPARVTSPAIDETPLPRELPHSHALRLAQAKAEAVVRGPGEIVLAGDTVVALGRRILPKAESEAEVVRLLGMLAGRRHTCFSAIAVIDAAGRLRRRLNETVVAFRPLSSAEIAAYATSGEGVGKAGGYAIQGRAEALIRFIHGSHSGVMGLPLAETRTLLRAAGLAVG